MTDALESFRRWQDAPPVPRDGRCRSLDAEQCRCLLKDGHRGPHDHSYTPWVSVVRNWRDRKAAP